MVDVVSSDQVFFTCDCGLIFKSWIVPDLKQSCPKCNSELRLYEGQTKLNALRSLDEDFLSGRRKQVFEAIRILKNPNNREIAEYLHLPINSITPRVKELREFWPPLVKESCSKIDVVTNVETKCWMVNL